MNSNEILNYLIDKTGDIILKSLTGVIIFFILDGIVSSCIYLWDNEKISPFYLTIEIYNLITILKNEYGTLAVVSFFYLILWGWGQLVYILRQVIFFEYLKKEYENSDKVFKKLRNQVIQKLNSIYQENNELLSIIETEKNDYLLYLILSKEKGIENKITSDADYVAFIGTNIIFIFILILTCYIFELYKIKTLNYLLSLLPYFLILIVYIMSKKAIEKRYISRNLRLYLNFLFEHKEKN